MRIEVEERKTQRIELDRQMVEDAVALAYMGKADAPDPRATRHVTVFVYSNDEGYITGGHVEILDTVRSNKETNDA